MIVFGIIANEYDFFELFVRVEEVAHCFDRNLCGAILWKAVYARADIRKGNGSDLMIDS